MQSGFDKNWRVDFSACVAESFADAIAVLIDKRVEGVTESAVPVFLAQSGFVLRGQDDILFRVPKAGFMEDADVFGDLFARLESVFRQGFSFIATEVSCGVDRVNALADAGEVWNDLAVTGLTVDFVEDSGGPFAHGERHRGDALQSGKLRDIAEEDDFGIGLRGFEDVVPEIAGNNAHFVEHDDFERHRVRCGVTRGEHGSNFAVAANAFLVAEINRRVAKHGVDGHTVRHPFNGEL